MMKKSFLVINQSPESDENRCFAKTISANSGPPAAPGPRTMAVSLIATRQPHCWEGGTPLAVPDAPGEEPILHNYIQYYIHAICQGFLALLGAVPLPFRAAARNLSPCNALRAQEGAAATDRESRVFGPDMPWKCSWGLFFQSARFRYNFRPGV